MAWIKRNLYFVIGSALAVVLMGLAGYYLYSKWDQNNKILADLDALYGEWNNLNQQNPHPGSGKVDNIKEAKEERKELVDYIQKSRALFQKITPIPDSPKLTDREFSPALSRTIAQLQREATNASVNLPPKYAFSFQAQLSAFNFPPGSLQPLSVQLGEVKAICDVLFHAKINWLDSIRREMVSTNDAAGAQTDYLAQNSVTNELAVVSPYEVSFRCFSPELASVLSGFASSPNGIIVKTINVEQAPEIDTTPGGMGITPAVQAPVYTPPVPTQAQTAAAEARMRQRYGGGGSSRYGGGSSRYNPAPPPPPPAATYTVPATSAPRGPGGLQTVLDEKLLKVTLTLQVVKLLPPK